MLVESDSAPSVMIQINQNWYRWNAIETLMERACTHAQSAVIHLLEKTWYLTLRRSITRYYTLQIRGANDSTWLGKKMPWSRHCLHEGMHFKTAFLFTDSSSQTYENKEFYIITNLVYRFIACLHQKQRNTKKNPSSHAEQGRQGHKAFTS